MSVSLHRYCSFCGKESAEVHFMLAGPTVFICNECIATCVAVGIHKHPAWQADVEEAIKDGHKKTVTEIVEEQLKGKRGENE